MIIYGTCENPSCKHKGWFIRKRRIHIPPIGALATSKLRLCITCYRATKSIVNLNHE